MFMLKNKKNAFQWGLEYADYIPPPSEVVRPSPKKSSAMNMTQNSIRWWASNSIDYSFITITLSSTRTPNVNII